MTEHWQTLLAEAGYPNTDERQAPPLPANFSAPAAEYSVLRLHGPDTLKFLQGQVTCDVHDLSHTHSVPGAACNPKGRAYALFQLLKLDDEDVLIRLPVAIADEVRQHLSKYLAFFKAEMTPADQWQVLGLQGRDTLQAISGETDLAPGTVITMDQGRILGRPPTAAGTPRAELWLDTTDLAALPAVQGDKLGPAAWRRSQIEAGELLLTPATAGQYIPQNLNLHALEGISYNKGCYTGQEVVARMHFLGQLKKSLFRLSVQDMTTAPTIGMAITGADGRKLGELVDWVATAPGQAEALAVLSHKVLTGAETPQLEGQPAARLQREPLGYKVPEQQPSE